MALVPSRSGGRVTLPMRLDVDSPVNLVVGGKTQRVADGAARLADLLVDNGVMVDADDRVTVVRGQPAGPPRAARRAGADRRRQEGRDLGRADRDPAPVRQGDGAGPGPFRGPGPVPGDRGRGGQAGRRRGTSPGSTARSWAGRSCPRRVESASRWTRWSCTAPRCAPKPEPDVAGGGEARTGARPAEPSLNRSPTTGRPRPATSGPPSRSASRAETAPPTPATATTGSTSSRCPPGGDGRLRPPVGASAAEQRMRAQALQQQSGWRPVARVRRIARPVLTPSSGSCRTPRSL